MQKLKDVEEVNMDKLIFYLIHEGRCGYERRQQEIYLDVVADTSLDFYLLSLEFVRAIS